MLQQLYYSAVVKVEWSFDVCLLIAERLSVRQIIPRRISEIVCMYVCMYPSRLGMPLFRATRANVGITCARVTPRNVTGRISTHGTRSTHKSVHCALYHCAVGLRFVSLRCRTTADCALYHCAVRRPPTSTGSAARSVS